MRRRWLVLSLLFVFASPAVFADGPETGVITGRVSDASGSPLPGVQVTLEGDRGTQVAVTGNDGKFVFGLVPPGSYRMTAGLEGFGSQDQLVNVNVGSRSDFSMTLAMATAEQITVTSEAPLVDKYNVTAGAVMQGETAGEISAAVRSFYGALQVLPGVTNDVESMDLSQSRPTVNGALWQESNVYIDGVDATFALQGGGTRVFLPSSALTEVNMEAGGGGAEYGRNVGSHTNLIVKSGTNRFHGDFNGVYSDNAWNSNYDPQSSLADDERFVNTFLDRGLTPEAAREEAINWVVFKPGERDGDEVNIEASVGGPIKRDKAWFFLSRGEVSTNQLDKTLDGQVFNVSSELFATIAKINFQPGVKHSLAYTFIDAPVDRIFLLPAMGDRYNATFFDLTGDVNSLSWNWSVSSSLFAEAKVASQVSEELTKRPFPPEVKFQDPLRLPDPALGPISPNNNDDAYVQNFDNTWHNGWIFGAGFGLNDYPRDQFNAAITQFAGSNHELKYGLDLQQVEWNQDVQRPEIYTGFDLVLGTRTGYANDCKGLAVDPAAGSQDTRCFLVDYNNHGLPKGTARSDGDNSALYIRDRIAVGDHWIFNVGARFEQQVLDNDRGRDVIDQGTLSPRFSTVYDITGGGRQLVTFNAGRFFVQTPQQLVNTNLQEDWNGASNTFDLLGHIHSIIPAFNALPATTACNVWRAIGGALATQHPEHCFNLGSVRPGTLWELHDQGLLNIDIEPYHRDELVLGYEWQYSQNWALDAKAIWWRVDDLIGSTLQRGPDQRLFLLVANYKDYPALLRQMGWVNTFVTGATGAVLDEGFATAEHAERILDGFADDHRRYRGVQLQLNRRFSKGWALFNNLSLSEVEGKTYGGGNGANDLGAFDNLNDDYGRNLEVLLTDAALDARAADPNFCAERGLAASCIDDLRPFVGQPISTVNRSGNLPVDRPVVFKSFGYRQWSFGAAGKQSFNLGGLFVWQSGSPWERTENIANPTANLLDAARNTGINAFLGPRGAFDNDDFFWLNLTGAWAFPIRGSVAGQLRVEVSNVTDEQEQVATSSRTGAPLRSRRSFQQPRKYRLVGTVRF